MEDAPIEKTHLPDQDPGETCEAVPGRTASLGPLACLLQGERSRNVAGLAGAKRPHHAPVVERATPKQRHAPRLLFLSELEFRGDVQSACIAAGCRSDEVAAWRLADPKFQRDYVLAIARHVKSLEQLVGEIALMHPEPETRLRARHLLASQKQHVGPDGRLNARSWRDALAVFAKTGDRQVSDWEPAPPLESAGAVGDASPR
jgi:hypothetical protein